VLHTISWDSEGVSISFRGPSAQGLPGIADEKLKRRITSIDNKVMRDPVHEEYSLSLDAYISQCI
jgi:hypothetical protein